MLINDQKCVEHYAIAMISKWSELSQSFLQLLCGCDMSWEARITLCN